MAQLGFVRMGDILLCGKRKIGVYITGSQDVLTNKRTSVRARQDYYVCPHAVGIAYTGSPNVTADRTPAHRTYDLGIARDGIGYTLTGSPNVLLNSP